ncbi:antibiotic biosynthesis monooxygenase [Zobellella taiwanensis]|jgi:quinol monooxygenase YgiN|uniref:Antibiotic biosynthesis monooxygenase n=1 Tax=Zobellella taiwanensis TaxID=347535 RepID=A0A2P7R161_9GAMM|nr:putative quinol monooxygenase [Zobellella taiwanensis]PSJ43942.1 antibiotic biosynthesis monooxygenase [Zobellella taiwanensis]
MYSIIVKTRLKPGTAQAFLDAMLQNAAASVRDEPGCHTFDVLQDRADPELFWLYEIYQDEAALAAHKETPHYQASRAVVNELIAEQSVIRADVLAVNPTR